MAELNDFQDVTAPCHAAAGKSFASSHNFAEVHDAGFRHSLLTGAHGERHAQAHSLIMGNFEV